MRLPWNGSNFTYLCFFAFLRVLLAARSFPSLSSSSVVSSLQTHRHTRKAKQAEHEGRAGTQTRTQLQQRLWTAVSSSLVWPTLDVSEEGLFQLSRERPPSVLLPRSHKGRWREILQKSHPISDSSPISYLTAVKAALLCSVFNKQVQETIHLRWVSRSY